jgi:hypothetical protein
MTPKEKAFHLHFSFIRDVNADNEKAKICAVKVIDEIILLSNNIEAYYWREVRKEIENI